ncbi:MAG: 5'-methylthioadenosine/adenosylhomocysteine nucleosidase [Clostridiales bacterium]|nr:5'-methylthioadenosine/adenosylhomocysteine nucleosidase [Clostridiales bacterium]
MKVGIVCAGDREVAPFLPVIDEWRTTEKAMLKFHHGKINGVEVVALFSGVCKVNAAIATQIVIDRYGVDVIINAGTAGGMNDELQIFDTVISTEVAHHDVASNILTEFHPWLENVYFKADQELLNLSRQAVDKIDVEGNVYWGRMVTGEAFIADEGRSKINEQFAPLTVDMETASIAQVCHANHIPFISIRTVTDTATHSGSDHFEENCKKASIIAKEITVALLAELHDKQ